jgi:hypothetical protein
VSAPVILVTAAGPASGSRAAAAALACAGSEPDRTGLLIDVGGRPPRAALVASAGARELEERLVAHLPQLRAASRGQTCHLAVPADQAGLGSIRAALPLVRDSAAAIHLDPRLLRPALVELGVGASGVLLRADLASDRVLTALAARDLIGRGLRVVVLKRPLGWFPARCALLGALPPSAPGGLPPRLIARLLQGESPVEHRCYDGDDDEETDPTRTSQQQRRGDAGAGWGRGLHRDPQRQADR